MNQPTDTTFKPQSVFFRFFSSLLICSLCLCAGILAERYYAQAQLHQWANSSAKLIAQRAAEKWLSDDRLSLQIVTRNATKQQHITRAAIFDSASRPLAEHGRVFGEASIQGRATIYTGNSAVGYVLVDQFHAANAEPWYVMALAPLLALLVALQTAISNKRKQRQQKKRTPFSSECLVLAVAKKPASEVTQPTLHRALPAICRYYNAEAHHGTGYVLMSFSDKNAVGRALTTARLWYGFYYALQRKNRLDIDAAVYVCLTPKHLVDDVAEQQWLFKTLYTTQHVDGVLLENSFAEHQIATEIATLAKRQQGYFLKQLCKEEDAIVLKQLNDLLKAN